MKSKKEKELWKLKCLYSEIEGEIEDLGMKQSRLEEQIEELEEELESSKNN